MMVEPSCARLWLLKLGFASADGATRALARVSRGILLERDNLECRAASLADVWARLGCGEGSTVRSSPLSKSSIGSWAGRAPAAEYRKEDDENSCRRAESGLQKGRLGVIAHDAPERAWSSCALHLEGRILFMEPAEKTS